MSIIDGKYIQPCVYDSGLWVTLMCPHCETQAKELIVKDSTWLQQERKEGIFAFAEEKDEISRDNK